jgi:hypothetical protein
VLSLHEGQTTDGEKTEGNAVTALSTTLGMETCKAHARRRTVMVALSENCGVEYIMCIHPDNDVTPDGYDRGREEKNRNPKPAPF